MATLDGPVLASLFTAVAVLLTAGRLGGEIARALRQPAVVGEILAGIALGPTLLGKICPGVWAALFPATGSVPVVLSALGQMAAVLLLFVAGTEVRVGDLARQGRVAATVSVAGILLPWASGFGVAYLCSDFMGRAEGTSPQLFALFVATAMSISAMAVIARTLMDLGLFRSDLGMTIMAAAVCEDFVGWSIFAAILGAMGDDEGHRPLWLIMGCTVAFAVAMLTFGRKLLHRTLPYLLAHTSWPQGLLGAMLAVAYLGAAATAHIGVHGVFGAFLAGAAIGDAPAMRLRAQLTLRELVESFFAPLLFCGIGLSLDFTAHFSLPLVCAVLVLGSFGKVVGCSVGARAAGLPWRQALAVGCGMNARGSMEIILGLLGLSHGIIREELFVALVLLTVVTASASGPLMQLLLAQPRRQRFVEYVREGAFVATLEARTSAAAIDELACRLAQQVGLPAEDTAANVQARERAAPTGLGGGVAIPHARLSGLARAQVAVGISRVGLDFSAPDGKLSHVIFVVLTPKEDEQIQLAIVADIARTFGQRALVQAARRLTTYTDFLALVRTCEVGGRGAEAP